MAPKLAAWIAFASSGALTEAASGPAGGDPLADNDPLTQGTATLRVAPPVLAWMGRNPSMDPTDRSESGPKVGALEGGPPKAIVPRKVRLIT